MYLLIRVSLEDNFDTNRVIKLLLDLTSRTYDYMVSALQTKSDGDSPLISIIISVLEFVEEIFLVFGVSIDDITNFRVSNFEPKKVFFLDDRFAFPND
jgi:hypothetical protein